MHEEPNKPEIVAQESPEKPKAEQPENIGEQTEELRSEVASEASQKNEELAAFEQMLSDIGDGLDADSKTAIQKQIDGLKAELQALSKTEVAESEPDFSALQQQYRKFISRETRDKRREEIIDVLRAAEADRKNFNRSEAQANFTQAMNEAIEEDIAYDKTKSEAGSEMNQIVFEALATSEEKYQLEQTLSESADNDVKAEAIQWWLQKKMQTNDPLGEATSILSERISDMPEAQKAKLASKLMPLQQRIGEAGGKMLKAHAKAEGYAGNRAETAKATRQTNMSSINYVAGVGDILR